MVNGYSEAVLGKHRLDLYLQICPVAVRRHSWVIDTPASGALSIQGYSQLLMGASDDADKCTKH